ANGAVVEVVDHRTPVRFAQPPVLEISGLERTEAAFGEDQVLPRECLAHERNVVEHLITAAPRLVPVEADAPHVLRGFRVGEDGTDPLVDEIAVMVPDDDLPVAASFSSQRPTAAVFRQRPL